MEEDDRLILILKQYGNEIINTYRRKLYEGGSTATGTLGNTISATVNAEDGIYTVTLDLESY